MSLNAALEIVIRINERLAGKDIVVQGVLRTDRDHTFFVQLWRHMEISAKLPFLVGLDDGKLMIGVLPVIHAASIGFDINKALFGEIGQGDPGN